MAPTPFPKGMYSSFDTLPRAEQSHSDLPLPLIPFPSNILLENITYLNTLSFNVKSTNFNNLLCNYIVTLLLSLIMSVTLPVVCSFHLSLHHSKRILIKYDS